MINVIEKKLEKIKSNKKKAKIITNLSYLKFTIFP